MNNAIKALASTLFLALASTVSAYQIPPMPVKCPAVSDIQITRFATAKPMRDGSYGAIQLSDYKTDDSWAFVMMNITASSSKDAIQKASAALPSLSFNSGPTYYSQSDVWACHYNVAGSYYAFAITPLPSQMVNTQTIFKAVNSVK